MPNSLVTHLRGYYQAMFKDIKWLYSDEREWRRDETRLLLLLGSRGSKVATIDFPAIDKLFTRSLALGHLNTKTWPYFGRCRRGTRIPVFTGALFQMIFEPNGALRESPSIEAIAVMRQLLCGLKKIRLQCEDRRTYEEVRDFFKLEAQIRRPTLAWDADDLSLGSSRRVRHVADILDVEPGDSGQLFGPLNGNSAEDLREPLHILQLVADRIASGFGDLHVEEPTELPKHGPGVVANHSKGDSKFSFPEWPAKLEAIFPRDLYGHTDFGVAADQDGHVRFGSLNECPSRLIAVPKTQKSPRLIAAEPSQHQWIQQLVRSQLERRIARTALRNCIFFRSQIPNQILASTGSFDGSYGTIDLSSASDRLSCWLVERLFRSNWTCLERFHACRTRWLTNNIDKKRPKYIRLNKFGAMGSAVTFPVQSICYAMIAITATVVTERGEQDPLYRVSGRNIEDAAKRVRVFGDDIIVPRHAFELTCRLLQALGLKVNTDKSFNEGNFRESCGVDAYKGQSVTPTYLLEPSMSATSTNLSGRLEVVNNFFSAGYWHISDYLLSQLGKFKHLLPVVPVGSGLLGVSSFMGYSTDHLKSRWNADTHQQEVRVMRNLARKVFAPTHGYFQLFQFLSESEKTKLNTSVLDYLSNEVPYTPLGTVEKVVVGVRPGWALARNLDKLVVPGKFPVTTHA